MTPARIRVIVVDDQPLARERLVTLVGQEAGMEVVAACGDGREAVSAITRLAPDLVFLDMQMPELDGFGVIAAVGPERMPPVIFVTAYDEFALRAFEVNALDYLLKPFARQRFQRALARARDELARQRAGELAAKLLGLVQHAERPQLQAERLEVQSGDRVLFVPPDRVDWIEAEGNYVRLHVGAESYLLRETMVRIEKRLSAAAFVRAHRSALVNIDRVSELRRLPDGELDVQLHDGTRLRVGRRYRDGLETRLRQATSQGPCP